MESILAGRHVTVFAEFGSDDLLDCRGYEILADYLPVNEAVYQQIKAWRQCLNQLDQSQSMHDEPLGWRLFADEGYR